MSDCPLQQTWRREVSWIQISDWSIMFLYKLKSVDVFQETRILKYKIKMYHFFRFPVIVAWLKIVGFYLVPRWPFICSFMMQPVCFGLPQGGAGVTHEQVFRVIMWHGMTLWYKISNKSTQCVCQVIMRVVCIHTHTRMSQMMMMMIFDDYEVLAMIFILVGI